MGAPQYEQAGADVSGSGTPGTIPVWSTGTTLGDSILKQSSGATSVGVGVTPLTSLAGYKSIEVGVVGSGFLAGNNDAYVTANAAFYSGGWKYAASAAANAISFTSGITKFLYASAGGAGGALTWVESARIDSLGRLLVGTATAPASASVSIVSFKASGSGGMQWHNAAGGNGGLAIVPLSSGGANLYSYTGAIGAESYGSISATLGPSSLDISTTSGYGLKLPATPGNADTQTLDCYQENYASNSWTPVIFGGTTAGTATYSVQEGFYTRWGNLIFCTATVVFSGHTGTGNLSLSGLPFAAKTAGSGTYRSSIIIEEGGGVKAILRLQSGTTATTTGVSIAASGNYVITFVYATN
jgi:hypothetical protein